MADRDALQESAGPLLRTIRLFFVVCAALIIIQLLLNPPNRRPEVMCWPLYKLGYTVTVDGLNIIDPYDTTGSVRNALYAERFFTWCKANVAKVPGFYEKTPELGE